MRRVDRIALILLVFAPLALAVDEPRPKDWPGWRGADRTGVSTEKGLLKTWPKEGPKLLWTCAGLGEGYSTPSVAGGKLFVMGSLKGEEFVHAIDLRDGKILWSRKIGKVGENIGPPYPGPRATPTIEGDRLYTLGSDGDLVCLECGSSKVVWARHLVKEFEGNRGPWAYTESPLVDGDAVVCTPGGPKAAMLKLDKKTGKVIWQMPLEEAHVAGYSSLVVAEVGKRRLYVQFMGAALVGVDAATGKFQWKYRKNVGGVNAMTPIVHDGCVFTSAAGTAGAGGDALLRLTATEAGVTAKQVYLLANMKNFHGGVVRIGGELYGTGSVGLVCLDFVTGEMKWKHRSIGQGSLMAADGHLYLRNTSGQVALVEARADRYVEKGRFTQAQRTEFPVFAHPVVVGGRLYLRDADLLFCHDIQAR